MTAATHVATTHVAMTAATLAQHPIHVGAHAIPVATHPATAATIAAIHQNEQVYINGGCGSKVACHLTSPFLRFS